MLLRHGEQLPGFFAALSGTHGSQRTIGAVSNIVCIPYLGRPKTRLHSSLPLRLKLPQHRRPHRSLLELALAEQMRVSGTEGNDIDLLRLLPPAANGLKVLRELARDVPSYDPLTAYVLERVGEDLVETGRYDRARTPATVPEDELRRGLAIAFSRKPSSALRPMNLIGGSLTGNWSGVIHHIMIMRI